MTDGAATIAGPERRRASWGRAISAAELVLFVGSIVAFIWLIKPATGRLVHGAYYLLMLGFAWLSAVAHGESRQTIGIRFDNFKAAARAVLPPTFALAVGLIAVGWTLGGRPKLGHALAMVPSYFLWALIQQYAFAFVQRRLWDAGVVRGAAVVSGGLFAVTHLPNPGLVALTFAAGWMWAAFYRRRPNLFALALSHALLAAVVVAALPPWFTAGLRVGPGYWHRASGASAPPAPPF